MSAGSQPEVVVAQLLGAARLALRALEAGPGPARGVSGPPRSHSGGPRLRIIGVGWATVELDRAATQLAASLGLPAGAWMPAPRDGLLGATARLGPPLTPGGPRLVLLEPDTEGRLAASLARLGEGVAAVYVTEQGSARAARRGAAVDRDPPVRGSLRRLEPGPIGPARLVLGGPAWGPHVLVVGRDPHSAHGTSRPATPESLLSGGD
ncbi:MAG TPA: hypothetical protein VEX41_08555 [Candidatus Eisenbacteria bacterium]|nr:hypothetical protein [Candidatus Eisenbacteria bacterium]